MTPEQKEAIKLLESITSGCQAAKNAIEQDNAGVALSIRTSLRQIDNDIDMMREELTYRPDHSACETGAYSHAAGYSN